LLENPRLHREELQLSGTSFLRIALARGKELRYSLMNTTDGGVVFFEISKADSIRETL